MKADDLAQFKEAIDIEVDNFKKDDTFKLMPINNKPPDRSLRPFVLSFN